MERGLFSEAAVNFYQTAQCHPRRLEYSEFFVAFTVYNAAAFDARMRF
jgi:hypothetical protein